MPDALIEIWQADEKGRYAHPADGRPLASNSFRGFGRCPTDGDGGYHFVTIKPGSVPGPATSTQAPHINVSVLGRGLVKRLFTRIYFPGEEANASDPILTLVPPDRRDTLIAKPDPARFIIEAHHTAHPGEVIHVAHRKDWPGFHRIQHLSQFLLIAGCHKQDMAIADFASVNQKGVWS